MITVEYGLEGGEKTTLQSPDEKGVEAALREAQVTHLDCVMHSLTRGDPGCTVGGESPPNPENPAMHFSFDR